MDETLIRAGTTEPSVNPPHRISDAGALLRHLHLGTHCLSLSWAHITPQVTPDALGPVEHRALERYCTLVDELLVAGIVPSVALYHWDLPQSLRHVGGWADPRTAERFAEYAAVVTAALEDRKATVIAWPP